MAARFLCHWRGFPDYHMPVRPSAAIGGLWVKGMGFTRKIWMKTLVLRVYWQANLLVKANLPSKNGYKDVPPFKLDKLFAR
jgi:hypothetical protein